MCKPHGDIEEGTSMGKLIKNEGKFYLFQEDGTYSEVSEEIATSINDEVKKRLDLELRLATYNSEVDSSIQSRLIVTKTQLQAAKKHIKNLTDLGKETLDTWSKGGNLHGTILKLRNQLEIVSRWLEDNGTDTNKK